MSFLIKSLIKHGKSIAILLDEAKSGYNREIIHKRVRKEVEDLLEMLKNPQLPASFPRTIIPKIIQKIQVTVQSFIKHDSDNATEYEDLAKKINNDWKFSDTTISYSESSLSEQPYESPAGDSTHHEASTVDDHQFKQLSEVQKMCLSCWCLFPAEVEIKKRELIFWWIGLDVIGDPLEGDQILAWFLEKGFIIRKYKKLCNSYKMKENVHSLVIRAISSFVKIENDLCFLSMKFDDKNVSLFINRKQNILSGDALAWIVVPDNVQVLHLGSTSWEKHCRTFIIIKYIEALNIVLRSTRNLTCLSLQGISGIVELPESVYKLDNLKILDLRACHNLVSLSEGIKSLNQLTHLDVSECYLLDHIPHEIVFLIRLRVLKGFVINPEDSHQVGDNANEKKSAPSMALFRDLSHLQELIKLTICTRRKNFPTSRDFEILFAMEKLKALHIFWVQSSAVVPYAPAATRFPKSLKKLQLQAAPKNTLPFLLWCISKDTESSLEKLCIRGGQHSDLDLEMHCLHNVHTVTLRYLPELTVHWDEFMKIFPKLTRLEIFSCPNLIFFPCDENGVWVKTGITMYNEIH